MKPRQAFQREPTHTGFEKSSVEQIAIPQVEAGKIEFFTGGRVERSTNSIDWKEVRPNNVSQ